MITMHADGRTNIMTIAQQYVLTNAPNAKKFMKPLHVHFKSTCAM